MRPTPVRRCSFLLACFACSAALAASFELPPIGGPGPAEHHAGKMIWADLVTPDLAASEQFYAGLFGWTFRAIDTGSTRYAIALLDGRPVAGMLQRPLPAGERRHPTWLPFLSVKDADAAERLAVSHGGKSISPPKDYRGRGRQTVLADPEGAVFGLLASSTGDPPDFLAEPGEWIWSSLFVRDPGAAAAFYKPVVGYDVFDLPSGEDDATHVIFSSDDYARAGVHTLLANGHRRPHWLNFARVMDAVEASKKALSLGGRVLEEPYVDRHGGKIAIIADPMGTPFGLMEWSETDSTAEPK
jgi:predicted enzyme related to lactoylglutathione lyase